MGDETLARLSDHEIKVMRLLADSRTLRAERDADRESFTSALEYAQADRQCAEAAVAAVRAWARRAQSHDATRYIIGYVAAARDVLALLDARPTETHDPK
jgi:hypothetical protein